MISVSIWSTNVVAASWSALKKKIFFVSISDACLYRSYTGKRFAYFAMAKDAEFEFMGALSMQGQVTWSPPAKSCVITGTNAFRWSILTKPLRGSVSPLHYVCWRAAQEERDSSLEDTLFSEYFLDSDCRRY